MDTLYLVLLLFAIVLLVIIITYLIYFLPKKQEKQKEVSRLKEDNEELKKTAFELKSKIEEISQKLITDKEVTKTLLENVDKSIRGEGVNIKNEIVNQQKLF